ncbi:MAG: alpha/beta hydrolase-fold protein [Acidobacteriota bacterium]
MHRAYHRWYSRSLGRDMELLVFGHAGPPLVVFPSSMGSFHEYEDTGMTGAVADKLEYGHLQLYCVTSVDTESWYNRHVHPRVRVARHLQYEDYILRDVVPLVGHLNPGRAIGVTGCSFGGLHAMLIALRHPWTFLSCITMSGAFDVSQFLDGYYDDTCYFLNPVHFLPNLHDSRWLGQFRRNKWVLATGEHDICRGANEHFSGILHGRGIPHSLHVWGDGSKHDWPCWRPMAAAYLP